ncbi:MAG: HIT domain-containing protein [Victivallales bacterium]|jgi:ATP adenylyltransferase|nr:HIT domain-containing protein [Victivallales bacterium]
MQEIKRPLWAPWRIEFIRKERSNECFLCGNETPSDKPENVLVIHRGKTVFAMLNRYPYNMGHLLVVPYRHIADLPLLSKEELSELWDLCVKCESVLRRALNPAGFNIGFNIGDAAGAGVADHLHMHIVPRWNGDNNFMPVLADIRCVPEALESTAKLLREKWEDK